MEGEKVWELLWAGLAGTVGGWPGGRPKLWPSWNQLCHWLWWEWGLYSHLDVVEP